MPWKSAKKNVLSLRIGPLTVPPNWCWLNFGLALPARLLNQLFASSESLRRNSNTLPWKSLPPDLIWRLTTPPMDFPNSAEYVLVCSLNSSRASTLGKITTVWSQVSLLSTPSSM